MRAGSLQLLCTSHTHVLRTSRARRFLRLLCTEVHRVNAFIRSLAEEKLLRIEVQNAGKVRLPRAHMQGCCTHNTRWPPVMASWGVPGHACVPHSGHTSTLHLALPPFALIPCLPL